MIEIREGVEGTLEGTLAEIRYRNKRDGFVIAEVATDDGRRLTVVGTLADAEVGTSLTLGGVIERDERFGLQFRITHQLDPQLSAEVAEAYLASGLVAHVGPATAHAIVDTFGADALRVLRDEPERLTAFRGITAVRLPAVRRTLRETIHLAPIVGLLDPFGVSTSVCRRIWRRHGSEAIERIRANPWRLAREIRGVGFTTADKVARGLGCDPAAPERIEAAVLQSLADLAQSEGHTTVAASVLTASAMSLAGCDERAVADAMDRLVAGEEIIETHAPAGYGLPRLVAAEASIAAKVRLVASFAEASPISVADAEIDRVAAAEGITFDASQRRAVRGALEDRITVITGGPGTGKTTIVRAVLDLAQQRGLSFALVSPTGRAAKRLAEATGRPARTIHRWLRYHPADGFRGPTELPDLLVVDETSMLDVPLARRVFDALPPYARLLLVGDVDQLPAIGPGNLLGDLIGSDQVTVLRLTEIHRTAAGSGVPALAAAVRSGTRQPPFDRLTTRLVLRETPAEIADYITATIDKYRDRAGEFQVLCPLRKGPAGSDALNRAIQAILNPPRAGETVLRRSGFELRAGDRFIVTANDYDNEIWNGEIGYLREVADDGALRVELDGEERLLPPGAGDGFALGYAISVHRAQGSEFEVVLIPAHMSLSRFMERRLLYTAVSRARKTVCIVGQSKAVSIAIGRHDPLARRTLLRGFLTGRDELPATLVSLDPDAEELF